MLILIFFIYLILIFSLQTTLLDLFSFGGVTPDLALILTVYCATLLRENGGIAMGFGLGFVQDCLSGGILGINTLSKSLIGFTFATLKSKLVVEGFVPIAAFLFVSSIVDGLVFYVASLILFKSGTPWGILFSNLLVFAIYNALIGPVLFYFMDKNKNWLIRRFSKMEKSSL